MSYQGHLPDGSSVQKHSAGSCYPFVVYGQETPDGLKFGVIGPRKTTIAQWSCAVACEVADKAAVAYHQKRQAKTASIYVAATDSVVQVPLNMRPAALVNPGRTYPPMAPPRYPDGWGVV